MLFRFKNCTSTNATANFTREINEFFSLNISVPEVTELEGYRYKRKYNGGIFARMTKDIAYIMGLYAADGHLDSNSSFL